MLGNEPGASPGSAEPPLLRHARTARPTRGRYAALLIALPLAIYEFATVTPATASYFLIRGRICEQIYNATVCAEPMSTAENSAVSAQMQFWALYCCLPEPSFSFPLILLYSIMSDKVGRKPLLLLSCVCSAICCVGWMFLAYFDLPLWVGAVANVVAILGGMTGLVAAQARAYAVDVHTAASPPLAFTYAVFTGVIQGTAFVSVMVGSHLFVLCSWLPFAVSAASYSVCFAMLCCFRESVEGKSLRRGLSDLREARRDGVAPVCKESAGLLWPKRPAGGTLTLRMWMVLAGANILLFGACKTILESYLPTTLGWGAVEMGNWSSFAITMYSGGTVLLVPLAIKWAPNRHARTLSLTRCSFLAAAVGFALFAVPNGDSFGVGPQWTYVLTALIATLTWVYPLLHAAVSEVAVATGCPQGATQGLLTNVSLLISLGLNFGVTALFVATVQAYPPAVVLVAAGMAVVFLILSGCMRVAPGAFELTNDAGGSEGEGEAAPTAGGVHVNATAVSDAPLCAADM